jgi:hypothetical protein
LSPVFFAILTFWQSAASQTAGRFLGGAPAKNAGLDQTARIAEALAGPHIAAPATFLHQLKSCSDYAML